MKSLKDFMKGLRFEVSTVRRATVLHPIGIHRCVYVSRGELPLHRARPDLAHHHARAFVADGFFSVYFVFAQWPAPAE